jgi:phage terminase large subunit
MRTGRALLSRMSASVTLPPNDVATAHDWYKPGLRIVEFHQSKAKIRALVGARGCGKTTAIGVEAIGHGWHNAGAKVYILRKTEASQHDTTLDTFEHVFRNCGTAYVQNGDRSLFKKIDGGKYFRIPSAEAVRLFNIFLKTKPNNTQIEDWLNTVGNRYCSFIQFAGVPDATKRDTRFRGYECSMLIFVEADQLLKEDLEMAMFCLRWRGADGEYISDTCCILDTNPPAPKHWIAKMETETANRSDVKFWHIPMEDNAHNLPPGYVETAKLQYINNTAMYKRMILGEYAEAFDGQRVLFAFSELHAYENLPWPRGAYLIRGWDFGTTNTIVWSAYWEHEKEEYWWDLYEYYATGSDVERQCRACWDYTKRIFPFYLDRNVCAGVFDACDPAGNQRTDKGRSLDVLATYQIYPKFSHKHKSLQLTLAAYNRLLERKDAQGRFVYRIDKETCPMLYYASLGGYRYPEETETGFGSNEPGKGPDFGNYDHVADAARYAKINFLRLMKVEMETNAKPVGPLGQNFNVNPKRQWR